MKKKINAAALRRCAEERLDGQAEEAYLLTAAGPLRALIKGIQTDRHLSADEARKFLHELEIHQIELSMQNEELLRKQCELAAARERYFGLYDLAPVGYCTTSERGLIIEANLTASTLLGAARYALVNRPLSRWIFKEDQDIYYLYLKQLLETGKLQVRELRMLKKDGTPIWVSLEATTVQDENGKTVFRIAISNITDRKRLEIELREAHHDLEKKIQERTLELEKINETLAAEIEERKQIATELKNAAAYNRTLIEASIDSFLTINTVGKITDVNRATEAAMGLSRDEIIGTDFSDYFTEPYRARAGYQQVLSEGVVRDYELQLQHRDGYALPVLYNASLYRDETGNALGIFAAARDITERKFSEWALKESEQRYRIVADNTFDWEFWLGPQHDVFYTSPSCERITGYLPHEFQQNPQLILEIVHPDDLPGFEEHHVAEFKSDYAEKREIEFRFLHKDGSVRWIDHVCQPVFSESGAFIGVRGSNRDITDRKRADEALKESEIKLRAIFDTVGTGIIIIDKDTQIILEANQTAIEMTGLPIEKIIGQICHSLVCPAQAGKCPVKDFVENVDHSERKLLCADGHLKDILKTVYPITIKGRDCYIESFVDISDRLRAEDALRESEEKYRNILENIDEMYFELDLKGNITFFNNATCRISGYSPSKVIGVNYRQYTSPEIARQLKTLFGNIYMTEEKGSLLDFEMVTKDKITRYMELSAKLLKNLAGEAIGFRVIARDITDRKQVDSALKESEKKYRLLAENSLAAIWIVNLEGSVTYMSLAIEKLLGYTVDEIMEIQMRGFIVKEDYNNLMMILAAELTKPREERLTFYKRQIRCKRKDGNLLDAEINVAWLKDDQGNIVGLQGSTTDITDRKRAEEENMFLERQLRQSQKMEAIGTLAGGIAHDFNNILGAISGFTELTQGQVPADSKANKYLKRIFGASRRAVDLVSQILTFSRQTEMELQPLRLSPIVKEVLNLVRAATPVTIGIRQNITAEPDMIMADATYIHQVVMNLCTNANHTMQKNGGVLSVGLINESILIGDMDRLGLSPGPYLKMTVSDTGNGIEPGVIDKIFDPFFTTKKQGEGTGLGLSVVHGIVKSLGGEIKVESRLGEGTVFSVWLPMLADRILDDFSEEGEAISIRGSGRILFVDDEEALVEMATAMLEDLGYEVTATQSSIEALEIFRANPDRFDLVITDQTMPEMTGMVLAHEIMAIRPDIPIILCTGFSAAVNAEVAKEAGIIDFIIKPIIKNKIAATIHQILTPMLSSTPAFPEVMGADSPQPPETSRKREQFTGVKALVAEDNEFSREVIIELLLQVGIEADIAINGREAVEMVSLGNYDILLMDIEMPELDGLTATREIRQLAREGVDSLPILALSGHAAGEREKSLAAGMNDHLTKPIDTVALDRALWQWLPREKYADPDRRGRNRTAAADEQGMLTRPAQIPLPSVPGLDVETALKRLGGDPELYLKFLGDFIPEYGEASAQLLLEVRTGCWEEAIRRVHSLKGVAGIIGGTDMEAAADSLEKAFRAARSCNHHSLRNPLRIFMDCHEALVTTIDLVLPRKSAVAPNKPEGPPWDAAELGPLLARLKMALSSEEPVTCEEILEALLQRPVPQGLEAVLSEVNHLIQRYRLAEAFALIEKELKIYGEQISI